MYKARQGITFFSSRPHRVHVTFAESVNADMYLFRFDGKTKRPYRELLLSPFLKKPDSDVYLCESPLYLFTVIPKKILDPEIKVILLATSPFRMYYEKQSAMGKYLLRKSLSYVDGIIAVSRYVADFFAAMSDCPVKVAYPYADISTYEGAYSDPSSKNIVFLGKMMPYKGVDLLIEAFKMIREKEPGSELYLMGHFKDESLKLPEIEGLNVAGKVEDPREYFSRACIYMHPAREEAFGVSIIEACASGLIPIVSKYTGAAEIIRPVCPDLVVDSLDPADYSERALKVMGWGPEKKKAVAEELRAVARDFTKDRSVMEFKTAFNELILEIDRHRKEF
ncbi:hypothetical protein CUJ83_01730 [Methanocella sp. CWC-04]|uniref:Uncharacterized protein n=1 Tax=Methanooceanicella nereidis TaxID=2052831 RepID=A0AAP2W405_9EURY|nr:glycosyltransferase family 4 protein [Methanocella sp. CWC-04]MCD1293715.1 hypothetical protein [Methanocella sp. CWC-04]